MSIFSLTRGGELIRGICLHLCHIFGRSCQSEVPLIVHCYVTQEYSYCIIFYYRIYTCVYFLANLCGWALIRGNLAVTIVSLIL